MDDFTFELEYAALTNDTDRAHLALLDRFPVFRPVDLALFGGWNEWSGLLTDTLGHLGSSDSFGNRVDN
jgi:hypothetical protein